MRAPRIALVVVATVLALAWTAPAREVETSLKTGERLEGIAERQLGNASYAELLRLHNRLSSEPRAGARIRLPVPDEHVASKGESFASLARRYWGPTGQGAALALLNGKQADEPIAPGERIQIPELVSYPVKVGDSFAGLARRYYGTPDRNDLLALLNPRSNPGRLMVGERVRIAVIPGPDAEPPPVSAPPRAVAPAPAPPRPTSAPKELPIEATAAPVTAAPAATAPGPSSRYAGPLRAAVNAYLDGLYEKARERLEALRGPVLAGGSEAERATLLRHLAYVYVASDSEVRACEAYRALLAVEPKPSLDPDFVSPKILRALAECDSG